MSAQHISPQGLQNTNGPNAADRDKGLQRAEDRMSRRGKAGHLHAKHKHHRQALAKRATSGMPEERPI